MGNRSLHKAKKEANDEYYTQVKDIENELRHFQDKFKGKVLYMNTDHPDHSMFYWHFKMLFEVYGLKKMIATFWSPSGDVFKTVYDGKEEVRTPLTGDGDFRSDECVEILSKEADIVVTNPPFSLFREYVNLLMKHNVEFLIMGNMNALTYKEIFPLIRDNKMWSGPSFRQSLEFRVPNNSVIKSKSGRTDSSGNKYVTVQGIMWYTNIPYPKRYDDLLLWASYKGSEDYYKKYDNYNAINIDKVDEIPYDYSGVMGVPISFIGKWNPKQFEILGIAKTPLCFDNPKELQPNDYYENVKMITSSGKVSNTASVNDAVIKVGQEPEKTYYIADNVDGYLVAPYARVLIRNLNPIDEIKV